MPDPCPCGPCVAARDQKGFSWGRACARLVDKVRALEEELRACRERVAGLECENSIPEDEAKYGRG